MTNKNRRGVNQHDKKQKDEIKKQFRRENRYEIYISAATLMIAIALFLIALYNNTTFFSMLLAVYALNVTVGFELLEWVKYTMHNSSSKKRSFFIRSVLKYYSLVLFFSSVSFVVILFIILILSPHFFENMCSQVPNILTILSLIGYFFSYTTRSYLQKKKEFIQKHHW